MTERAQADDSATKACERCGAENRLAARFCRTCATPFASALVAPNPPPTSQEETASGVALAQAPPFEAVLKKQVRSRRSRQLYFELGLRLLARNQPNRSIKALRSAKRETGPVPSAAQVEMALATACDRAGSEGDGHRDEAIRSYLELALLDPSAAERALRRANELLAAPFARLMVDWLTREWWQRPQAGLWGERARVAASIFVVRTLLLLERYEEAITFLEKATADAPEVTNRLTRTYLAPRLLPAKLAQPGSDGDAHFVMARIHAAMGSDAKAVEALDNALNAGIHGATSYPEAPAWELKGRLLDKLGRNEGAAQALIEAGRRFHWRAEWPRSARALERALELRPEHAEARWFLMESLRMEAGAVPDSKDKEKIVDRALAVWSGARSLPATGHSWAYATRALLTSSLPFRRGERISVGRDDFWEAIVHIECALILDDTDAFRWASLALFFRLLEVESNALAAGRHALSLDPGATFPIEETFSVLANMGASDDALEVLATHPEKETSQFVRAVRAYVLLGKGDVSGARSEIDWVVERDSKDTWFAEVKLLCRIRAGETPARDDFAPLLRRVSDDTERPILSNAWAACRMGDIAGARAIYQRLADEPVEARSPPLFGLGTCDLADGLLPSAEEHLLKGIELTINRRQIDDLIAYDLDGLRARAASGGNSSVLALVDRVRAAADERRRQLATLPSARDELDRVLRELEGRGDRQTWASLGAHAGLARMNLAEDRFDEAALGYEILLQDSGRFPAAKEGLRTRIAALQERVEAALRAGDGATALRLADGAARLARCLDEHPDPNVVIRRGLARFVAGDGPGAREDFAAEMRRAKSKNRPPGSHFVGTTCAELLDSMDTYWRLADDWRRWGEEPSPQGPTAAATAGARTALSAWLDREFQRAASDRQDPGPTTTPIAMVVAVDLLPAQGEWTEWPLFTAFIPGMRARLKAECGVTLTGIRIHTDVGSLTPGSFVVRLDEIPVILDYTHAGMRYCAESADALASMGIPHESVVAAIDPRTGRAGAWVPDGRASELSSRGIELLEPLHYAVVAAESLVRANLGECVGVQETAWILAEWSAKSSAAAAILAEPKELLRFARLLRALVAERVPVVRLGEIADEFLRSAAEQVEGDALLDRVRTLLRDSLPGNRAGDRLIAFDPSLERTLAAGIQERDGLGFLVLEFGDVTKILAWIRPKLDAADRSQVVVTADRRCRVHLRRLILHEFPHAMVIAAEELNRPVGAIAEAESRHE